MIILSSFILPHVLQTCMSFFLWWNTKDNIFKRFLCFYFHIMRITGGFFRPHWLLKYSSKYRLYRINSSPWLVSNLMRFWCERHVVLDVKWCSVSSVRCVIRNQSWRFRFKYVEIRFESFEMIWVGVNDDSILGWKCRLHTIIQRANEPSLRVLAIRLVLKCLWKAWPCWVEDLQEFHPSSLDKTFPRLRPAITEAQWGWNMSFSIMQSWDSV